MSEKARFYNMTKPIKFRRLKMFKQMIVLWCKAQRERIIYLFNYLLYKLGYLKRYSYRTNTDEPILVMQHLKAEEVESKYVGGVVDMHLVFHKDIDMDYFYREKNGQKKITFVLRDKEDTHLYSIAVLKDICLNVGNQWHSVDSLPLFKWVLPPELKPTASFGEAPTEPLQVTTVTYDVMKIKQFCHKNFLGVNIKPYEVSQKVLEHYYDVSVRAFKNHLSGISLKDLMCR